MKKDYKNTPSTTLVLFYVLITFFIVYISVNVIHYDSPLLLIKEPVYLNSMILDLNQKQLTTLIIESRPWYEQILLNLQEYNESLLHDLSMSDIRSGISRNILHYDRENDIYVEGFTSVMLQELFPVHLNISEYDRYILKQAIYRDTSIVNELRDASDNPAFINAIIIQQESLMNLYERIMVKLTYASANNVSKRLLGDINESKYHYSISFWLYLYADQTMVGEDKILIYGSRPSMYYDHKRKELKIKIIDHANNSILLYNTNQILYQRWNHIVMNYNYGTFDLFINNYLVYTIPGIVNEIQSSDILQVGFLSNNDLGGITQLLYSDEPLELSEIQKLYLDKPKI